MRRAVVLLAGSLAAAATRPADPAVAAARADLKRLMAALEVYDEDAAAFPTTKQGLAALVRPPAGVHGWHLPCLDRVPTDPWGHAYVYRSPGADGADYDLLSRGPDGVEGTADDVR